MGKKHRKNKQKQREQYYQQGKKTMQTTVNQGYYYDNNWKNCHNGPISVFDVGNSVIHAGSQWEMDSSYLKFDLFICANGEKGQFTSLVKLDDARGLLAATQEEITESLTPTFLTIDIPDGGAPDVGPRFWKSVVSDIRDKGLSVAVYCQGGHGRTGVVLACLAHYGCLVPLGEDVVKFVRERYCSEAIETTAQFNYLRHLGMTTEQLPSFKPIAIGQPNTTLAKMEATEVPSASSTTLSQRGVYSTVPVKVVEGTNGVTTVIAQGDTVPQEDRATTQEEMMAWEKELIEETEQKQREHDGSLWDYSG